MRRASKNSSFNPIRRLRSFDALTALLGAAAFCMIVPFRGISEAHPPIAFLSTFLLFLVPGLLLSRWYLCRYFTGAALLPAAFVISGGIFGVLALPFLMLHAALAIYLWASGAVVIAFLVAAAARTSLRIMPAEIGSDLRPDLAVVALWLPCAALTAALAYACMAEAPGFYGDMWVYLAWVREYLSTDHLALRDPYIGDKVTALSRVKINGWLLEQAAFSRVSGLDPVGMVMHYLAPTLVVVAMSAFYALARSLFKSKVAALFIGCLYALFFLLNLTPSQFTFGGEFVGRIAEDKFVAKFIFFPVALCLAVMFLESRKFRYLAAFAFVSWSVVTIHPVGLAMIGLSMAGFGLVHVTVNPLSKRAWTAMVELGAALLSVGVFPALMMVVERRSFVALLEGADINSGNPAVLANMVFVVAKRKRIFLLDNGNYIMHPYLLHDPVILGALLLGLPFLVRRLRNLLAAQLLAGALVLVTVVCYVPPIATFFGNNIVVPGQLWRLAWPLPCVAVLTAGWMGWEATRRLQKHLNNSKVLRQISEFLPLVLLGVMMVVGAPASIAAVDRIYDAGGLQYREPTCFASVFPWIQNNITRPSVILAPDRENTCIPSYSAKANVVSMRGSQVLAHRKALERRVGTEIKVPRRALDEHKFFTGADSTEKLHILERYNVNYVMARAGGPTDKQLRRLTGLSSVEVPGDFFDLYKVDRIGARTPR